MKYSTEQVSKWHPDKYADQISDSIVNYCVSKNKNARVAVEAMVKNNNVYLAGEIGNISVGRDELIKCAESVAKKLNYKIDNIYIDVCNQSQEINHAVDVDNDIMAGDQGMVYGYATNETNSYLPLGFHIANKIIERLEEEVKDGILKGDAKTQIVTDGNTIETVLVSVCYSEKYGLKYVRNYIKNILKDIVQPNQWLINPSGAWHIGGPTSDAGLTGRKIVADQYGGYRPVGGGAFSGKDLSKVDRSGAYMARNIAIDMVDKFELEWCEIQIGYGIGIKEPLSINVKADKLQDKVYQYIISNYDLTPKGMIDSLGELNYEKLAEGCHYRYGKIR